MRYPVNNFKTEWNGYSGYGFGAATTYGFHDGVDINDNGGGNSDLGKDIFAIANGELVYWHGAKHPTTGFGYHSVYKIVGSWGTRWVHQAHCLSDMVPAVKPVAEGEKIARVGNTGTTYAHIHFAVFKVDPATLPNGIDTIAKTQQQLNDWWEDPIKFIEKWMAPADQILVDKATFEKLVANSTKYDAFVAAGFPDVASVKAKILQLEGERNAKQAKLDQIKVIVNG
jgi:Peptidase family M23